MMYSAYRLNKQGDNIQPWGTPFPIWNQSVVPCPLLTVASWTAYRFLKRQVRWSGIPISFRIFQFIVIHTVKGFGIVNKAEVDVFLELSCFFDDPADLAIWSLVPLPFLKPAWTSGISRLTYCWRVRCSELDLFSIYTYSLTELIFSYGFKYKYIALMIPNFIFPARTAHLYSTLIC